MNIPTLVAECLQAFRLEVGGHDSEVFDELGRFKVWVGNLAAHRPASSRRSLEYRLRDSSSLRDAVLLLLCDLKNSLRKLGESDGNLQDIALSVGDDSSEESDSIDGSNENYESHEIDESDDDDNTCGVLLEHEEDDVFELTDEEIPDDFTPIKQVLDEVHEIVTCLLRFSMTLRNPSRIDARKRGPPNDHFLAFDIEHVRNKFPEAPKYLVKRLGHAISAHRQYFRYREMHHAKLQEGLEENEGTHTEHPSTVATSLPEGDPGRVLKTSAQDSADVESVYTATSYASTAAGTSTLRPPPFPAEAQAGDPFECPICFGIIEATNEHSWKQHVFEDVPPYICTHEVCPTAGRPFARRHEWLQHEKHAHNLTWLCPLGCAEQMQDVDALKLHMRSRHDQRDHSGILQQAVEISRAGEETLASRVCILCRKEIRSFKWLGKHLGHHMEQLALFALPLSEEGDGEVTEKRSAEDAQKSVADEIDERGDWFEYSLIRQQYDQGEKVRQISEAQALEQLSQNNIAAEAAEAPIKLLDAVGRKFTFPWHTCKTWKGMESNIKKTFLHDHVVRERVDEGLYDLIGTDDLIILPEVWDSMVRPGLEVSIHMWPLPERRQDRPAEIPVKGPRRSVRWASSRDKPFE